MFTDFIDDRIENGFNIILKWISYSPRSERECINHLFDKGFHKNEIEEIVQIAKEDSIINDELYVDIFISSYKNKYGKKRILDKLLFEKGIDKELAKNKLDDELTDSFENELSLNFANKYIRQKNIDPKECFDKLIGYLLGKGFNWSNINFVKNQIKIDSDYDEN